MIADTIYVYVLALFCPLKQKQYIMRLADRWHSSGFFNFAAY